jgi:hypothetical protein
VLSASQQTYDTNFYALGEATSLLAGDHPYRDFFEWGVPLHAYVSAAAQWAVGYRFIGDILVSWAFIIAGTVISFSLGLRLSRSVAASLVTLSLVLPLVAAVSTFHYPKLFFYPLGVWLGWWYLERPAAGRAAVFGVVTAVAFLYRHDHGVYIGGLAVLTFLLTRVAVPAARQVRSSILEASAFTAAAALVVSPWAIAVHTNEGLPEYVESRSQLYAFWSANRSPHVALRRLNPIATLSPEPLPPPRRGEVAFRWSTSVDGSKRAQLERTFELRRVAVPENERDVWRYELPNVYDLRLLELRPWLDDAEGFDWEPLYRADSVLPSRANSLQWIEQISLLVPLLLLGSAASQAARHWHHGQRVSFDVYRMVLAATFLTVLDSRLFREPSYAIVVAPLTAALGAPLLVWDSLVRPVWNQASRMIAAVLIAVTAITTIAFTRDQPLFNPATLPDVMSAAFSQMLASPHMRSSDGATIDGGLPSMLLYVRSCTRAGDRVLVTGSTPYQVNYLVGRAIAGGHLFWQHGWRRDAVREGQSLALLQRQSVPFAVSTHNPVLGDFQKYPRIHDYLARNYAEIEGSAGLLLVDRRRRSTGTFGPDALPCFR